MGKYQSPGWSRGRPAPAQRPPLGILAAQERRPTYRTTVPAVVTLTAVAATVVVADVASKAAVGRIGVFGIGHRSLGLRRHVNRRASVVGLPSALSIPLLALATAAILVVAISANPGTAVASGLGLAVGGAIGNVVDRVRNGSVVDFVIIGRWPPFNVADVALVAGVVVASAGVIT